MSFLSFLGNIEHSVANAVTGHGGNNQNQKQQPQQKPQPQQPQPQQKQAPFLSFLSNAANDAGKIVKGVSEGAGHAGAELIKSVATQNPISATPSGMLISKLAEPTLNKIEQSQGAPKPGLESAGYIAGSAVGQIPSLLAPGKGAAEAAPLVEGAAKSVVNDVKSGLPSLANERGSVGSNTLDLRGPQPEPPATPGKGNPPIVTKPAVPSPTKTLAGEATTETPQNVTQRLIKQASTFDPKTTPSTTVENALTSANSAKEATHSFDWLNQLRGTQNVAAQYFGKVGADTVYKLSQGAKTVADLQEHVAPMIQDTQKLLGKVAKTSAGKADVQKRITQALEDRANAGNYLKTPAEKQLFDKTAQVLDFFKQQRESRGLSTISENYSPRAAVQDALDAPDKLLKNIQGSFSTNAESAFSKARTAEEPKQPIDTNIVNLLPRYASSQAKEFGYSEPLQYFKDNIDKVDPVYLTNDANKRTGEQYLNTLFNQVLNPNSVSKTERFLNQRLQQTYRSTLSFSPRFALQNLTQRLVTGSEVSPAATRLSKQFTNDHLAQLKPGLASGENPLTAEQSASEGGVVPKISKYDPGQRVEKGNVDTAFTRGAAQHIIDSQPYKDAIAAGSNKKDAITAALQDPQTKDLAIRRGNVVVNNTQFGVNSVLKPQAFRDNGFSFGVPKSFFKQYQRFSAGMTEKLSEIVAPGAARELDILKRGDPTQTPIVDYKRAAVALQGATNDLIKGIQRGEVQGVELKDAKLYKDALDKAVNGLDKQIKVVSQIRGPKTARQLGKMWAAASLVQFLFNGGNPGNAVTSGAPVNVPQVGGKSTVPGSAVKAIEQAPGVAIPALPQNASQVPGKLLNFVPVVGPVYNRSKDVGKLIKTLSGGQ